MKFPTNKDIDYIYAMSKAYKEYKALIQLSLRLKQFNLVKVYKNKSDSIQKEILDKYGIIID